MLKTSPKINTYMYFVRFPGKANNKILEQSPHPEKKLQAYDAFAASTFHSIHFLRFVWSVDY